MLHFVLPIFSCIKLYRNVHYVPKARIARADINDSYLDAVINILRAQRQQCAHYS
jgi:hypothetical protein